MVLPELVQLEAYNGNWTAYVDAVYKYYLLDLVNSGLTFQGLPVRCQFRPPTQGKHYGFWHVISTGNREEERTPDLSRCERIRWIAWVIRHADISPHVTWWENRRWGSIHVVLFFEEQNYIVVLAKRTGYFLLKTAYCAEPHRIKSLEKEREMWVLQKRLKPPLGTASDAPSTHGG